MASVMLTVSGTIDPNRADEVARGNRPRADYLEMARGFNADLIDYAQARQTGGVIGKLFERIGGPDFLLAWACFKLRRRYQVILTDGEQIGLPFALLSKVFAPFERSRPRHLMITHIISVRKKMLFLDFLRVQSRIDTFLVYATWQKRFIERRWKIAPERVVFTHFMVDADFFAPNSVTPQPTSEPMVCAVGLEARDYATLLKAVPSINARFVIAAASPWSKRADKTRDETIPSNVTVQRFSQYDLRQLYADSNFLVMPLDNVNFQAGVTAILEAMAMGKAVICSRTLGQTDVIVEGKTGLYVPPGDPEALRSAIEHLLNNPDEARRMGEAGRRCVEELMSLDVYVEYLNRYVHSTHSDNAWQETPSSISSR